MVAIGTFLSNVASNVDQFLLACTGLQPLPVGHGPHVDSGTQSEVQGVRRDQRITSGPQMRVHAGPAIVLGLGDHRCPYRIQFDATADR